MKRENKKSKGKFTTKSNKRKIKTVVKEQVVSKSIKKDSTMKTKVKKVFSSVEKDKKKSNPKKNGINIKLNRLSLNSNAFNLTDQQKADLKKYEEELSKKSIVQLKAILKENNQVCTGNKNDLVDKCAQGKLLGALPNCPTCFAGRLRFNIKTGGYRCPGYMDDTEFKFCDFRAKWGEVQRNTWID